jgi:hypothetical protein
MSKKRRLVHTINKGGAFIQNKEEAISRTTTPITEKNHTNERSMSKFISVPHLIYLLICFYQADAQFHYRPISRQPSWQLLYVRFVLHWLRRELMRMHTRGIGLRLSQRHLSRHADRCTSSGSGGIKRRRLV